VYSHLPQKIISGRGFREFLPVTCRKVYTRLITNFITSIVFIFAIFSFIERCSINFCRLFPSRQKFLFWFSFVAKIFHACSRKQLQQKKYAKNFFKGKFFLNNYECHNFFAYIFKFSRLFTTIVNKRTKVVHSLWFVMHNLLLCTFFTLCVRPLASVMTTNR
jgi:hypothetical protein